jgi:acyl carrier protein
MKERVLEMLKEIRPEFEFAGVENFFEEGMLDSFDLVTLVTMLEQGFDVKIDGAAILPENFANVDAIVSLVQKSGAAQ